MKLKMILSTLLFSLLFIAPAAAAPSQYIYDQAGLLTETEINNLEQMAAKYSNEREISFVVLTTNDTNGKYIKDYLSDFVDSNPLGYETDAGSTAIIGIDMMNRDVYLQGYGKAETYLDSERLTKIREKVTPHLSNGDYEKAFEVFIEQSYYYSGFKPGYNPDNIFHKLWFQLLVAISIGAIVVFIMIANRGGKVTVNQNTYIDSDHSGIANSKDTYVTTHITKVRKPSNNNGGGSGGLGGGMSGGGRSFSGSGGKF